MAEEMISKEKVKRILIGLWEDSSSYEDYKRSVFAWINYELKGEKDEI